MFWFQLFQSSLHKDICVSVPHLINLGMQHKKIKIMKYRKPIIIIITRYRIVTNCLTNKNGTYILKKLNNGKKMPQDHYFFLLLNLFSNVSKAILPFLSVFHRAHQHHHQQCLKRIDHLVWLVDLRICFDVTVFHVPQTVIKMNTF